MDFTDIWQYIKLGLDLKKALTLDSQVATTAALNEVDNELDDLVEKYTKHKDKPENIRAAVDKIMDFLMGLTSPKLSWVPTAETAMGNAFKAQWALLARDKIFRIYNLRADNKLPPDPVPWSQRRATLMSMRDALVRFGIQVDSVVRRTDKDIAEAEAAEDKIRDAAHDPIITKEELVFLEQDWKDWIKTEQDERAWKATMQSVSRSCVNSVQRLSEIITAGDRANQP